MSLPLLLALSLLPSPARAWDDHTLEARLALSGLPEVADSPEVVVEPIEDFLAAEQAGLAELLEREEAWARARSDLYPPRPDELAFPAQGGDDLRTAFLHAIRANPEVRLALYLKLPPGEEPPEGAELLSYERVTLLRDPGALGHATLLALHPGDRVPALEVVAAAADEPDYGQDLGLFEDNGTAWGATYGFGPMPFGNPKLEFASQAPFHMGFYHEAGIVYALASFLEQTYPEYRAHLYYSLARFAFETGHPYWGWRFTGWGLHHVEDLTQPYHARVLPGVSVGRMLWINTLAVLGAEGAKEDAVQLVSNRHLALEWYTRELVESLLDAGDDSAPVLAALRDGSRDASYGGWSDDYLRDVLTAESAGRADRLDELVASTLPEHDVSDPSYNLVEQPGVDYLSLVREQAPRGTEELDALIADCMGSFGAHSRNFVRAVRAGLPAIEPPPPVEEASPEVGEEGLEEPAEGAAGE